jgi:hypothetical protein
VGVGKSFRHKTDYKGRRLGSFVHIHIIQQASDLLTGSRSSTR